MSSPKNLSQLKKATGLKFIATLTQKLGESTTISLYGERTLAKVGNNYLALNKPGTEHLSYLWFKSAKYFTFDEKGFTHTEKSEYRTGDFVPLRYDFAV